MQVRLLEDKYNRRHEVCIEAVRLYIDHVEVQFYRRHPVEIALHRFWSSFNPVINWIEARFQKVQ